MRLFPALRAEVIALVTLAFASPAFADTPATSGAVETPANSGVPRARTAGVTFGIEGGNLVLSDSTSAKTFRLHPLAAAVYGLADGQRSLESVRAAAEASSGLPLDEGGLFAVLDALADANLLVARVTPPGSADFGSFVASDGTLGSALLEPSATKGAPEPTLASARMKEEARKVAMRPERVRESAAKRDDTQLQRAREQTAKARESEARVRRDVQRTHTEESKKQAGRAAAPMQDAVVAAAKLRSEQLAKAESTLRRSEQDSKATRPETEAARAAAKKKKATTESESQAKR